MIQFLRFVRFSAKCFGTFICHLNYMEILGGGLLLLQRGLNAPPLDQTVTTQMCICLGIKQRPYVAN